MDEKTEATQLDHLAAWQDFYSRYRALRLADRKAIGLTVMKKINVAHQDFLGKRKGRDGAPLRLGSKRVAEILDAASAAMPHVFQYTHRKEWWDVGA